MAEAAQHLVGLMAATIAVVGMFGLTLLVCFLVVALVRFIVDVFVEWGKE